MSATILAEPELQLSFPSDDPTVRPTEMLILRLAGTPAVHLAHAPAVTPLRDDAEARPQRVTIVRRRRAHLDWEAVAVILLMLACAAVGVYRLLWMGQI